MSEQATRASSRIVRVMIVDDHPLVRHGLAELINTRGDFEVVAEAGAASEALSLLREVKVDLVLVDLTLEDGSGLDLIKQIRSQNQEIKMLVTSAHDEEVYAERALRAGAGGYLMKDGALDEITEAIRAVVNGRVWLSPRMQDRLLNRVVQNDTEEQTDAVSTLSDREIEVFELMGGGLTLKEIAARLHLSPKTIETHREHIKQKLAIDNNNQLVRHAVEWKLRKMDGAV